MTDEAQSSANNSRTILIVAGVALLGLCLCAALAALIVFGGVGTLLLQPGQTSISQPAPAETVELSAPTADTEQATAPPTVDQAYQQALKFAGDWQGEWVNNTFGSSGAVTATTSVFEDGSAEFVVDFDGFVFGAVDPDPKTYSGSYDANGSTFESAGDPLFGDVHIDVSNDGQVTISGEMVPIENIASFEAVGSIAPNSLHLDYTVTFPGGGEAVGVIDMEKTASGAGNGAGSPVIEFLDQFVAALQSADVEFLLARLHPAVLARYGEAACQAYLPGVTDPDFALEVLEVLPMDDWNYDQDGIEQVISDAIPVSVRIESQGQLQETIAHYAEVNGEMRWFTDCGDPLAE